MTPEQMTPDEQLAAICNPEIPAGSIEPMELQRQLGEMAAKCGVLENRVRFLGQLIQEKDAEIKRCHEALSAKAGKGKKKATTKRKASSNGNRR